VSGEGKRVKPKVFEVGKREGIQVAETFTAERQNRGKTKGGKNISASRRGTSFSLPGGGRKISARVRE